jgi:hypothetical protein
MTDPNDDLADVLAPRPGEPQPELRDALLRRTEQRLARNRWARRGARAAAVATVFLAGSGAGWLAHRPHVPEPVPLPVPEVVAVPVVVPVLVTPSTPSPPTTPPLSASAAELRAEQADDRAEAAKLYRLAGDAFLRDQDYRNATRCYRLFLARGGDSVLSLESDDSWLLTSLKNAAFKEKADVVPKIDG